MTVKELIEKLDNYKNLDIKVLINNSFEDFDVYLGSKGVVISTRPYFSEDDYWDLSEYRGTSIDADRLEAFQYGY